MSHPVLVFIGGDEPAIGSVRLSLPVSSRGEAGSHDALSRAVEAGADQSEGEPHGVVSAALTVREEKRFRQVRVSSGMQCAYRVAELGRAERPAGRPRHADEVAEVAGRPRLAQDFQRFSHLAVTTAAPVLRRSPCRNPAAPRCSPAVAVTTECVRPERFELSKSDGHAYRGLSLHIAVDLAERVRTGHAPPAPVVGKRAERDAELLRTGALLVRPHLADKDAQLPDEAPAGRAAPSPIGLTHLAQGGHRTSRVVRK